MGATASKSSGTSQASTILYEPDSVKLQRAALALGNGQLEQAIQELTRKNINSFLPGSGFPIIFDIFNYRLRLEERHVNIMIEKGLNGNFMPPCLIKEHKASFSVSLYAVHKIAELRTKILSIQRKEHFKEKEDLIEHERTVYDNLSLLIKHGLDINMPAESLTEETLKAFTTAPVIMYRPIQLAIAKKQPALIDYLLKQGANPNALLQLGKLEYHPVHVACMTVSPPNAIETLKALVSSGKCDTASKLITTIGSIPLHYLAEAAVMTVKTLETAYPHLSKEDMRVTQLSHIGVMQIQELVKMTEILRDMVYLLIIKTVKGKQLLSSLKHR